MDMVKTSRFLIAALAFTGIAAAQDFAFALGSPVAAGEPMAKKAVFVVRTQNCADPSKAQVSGTAEGLVNGARRTMELAMNALSRPGVYAIYPNWPKDGKWVVSLRGGCMGSGAGLIVPVADGSFVRESAQFLNHHATEAEVTAVLSKGDNK